jgi:ADP-ribose pyrophosphatase
LIEKVLSSRKVYDGKLVKVRADTVSLPDGETTVREVVEHPGAVAILPFLDSRIVMVRQYRHPAGKALLEVPAGTLRLDEKPEECARRELIEETGFKAERLVKMFQCFLAAGYSSELIHVYLATDLSKVAGNLDSDEFIQVQILDMAEALRKIERGDIEDAKAIAAILYAKHLHLVPLPKDPDKILKKISRRYQVR